jgi:hypothetical protein
MKKVIFSIITLAFTISLANAQLKSEVSECFELTGIVSRLAGAPEFSNNLLLNYANAIDSYFAPYIDHPLILFMKEIRERYGISYNAVPTATASLVIKNGKVTVSPDFDISRISEFDPRWDVQTYKKFVTLLNDFYRKTKFRNFYMQHTELHKVAVERLDVLLKSVHPDWFVSFFGEELGNIDVFVSLSNGTGNLALPALVEKRNRCIVIGTASDQEGLPWFSPVIINIILHELMHHHANSRINACLDQIAPAAQKIFPHIKEKMDNIGYGSAGTTMIEWFNNLCVILYFRDNPGNTRTFEQLTGASQYSGFIWMDRSVRFMEHFHKNRDRFTTIDDYMPQLIGHINYTADNFDYVLKEYENYRPYIVEVFPAPGTTLTQDIKAIEIRFSQVMYGPHGIGIIEDENISVMPYSSENPFWKDEYTYIIPIDPSRIEKGKIYGFKLPRAYFQNRKMYAIKEDYICTFNTDEE